MWQPAPHRTRGAWLSAPVTLLRVVSIPSDISAAVSWNGSMPRKDKTLQIIVELGIFICETCTNSGRAFILSLPYGLHFFFFFLIQEGKLLPGLVSVISHTQ